MNTLYFLAGLGLGILICSGFFWWIVNEELKEIEKETEKERRNIAWPRR